MDDAAGYDAHEEEEHAHKKDVSADDVFRDFN
jgi:hypothetical protein